MMSYSDRTRDILERAKRLKARQRKNLLKNYVVFACIILAAIITVIVIFPGSSDTPAGGEKSDTPESTYEESTPDTTSEETQDISEESFDDSGEESGEDSSETSEIIPEMDFAESKNYLLENTDQDYDIPQVLDDSAFPDALENASDAFAGRIKRFGTTLTKAKAETLITLYVEVTDSLAGGYAGIAEFKCPYYYLNLLSEDEEYLFLVFDYESSKGAYGSDYFAILPKDSLECMIDGGKTDEITSAAGSAEDIMAYLSSGYKAVLAFVSRLNSPDLPYTVVLKNEGFEIKIYRDNTGMMVSVLSEENERRFYRLRESGDVFKADLARMKLELTDGFSYVLSLTDAFGIFINPIVSANNRPISEQYNRNAFDFTDGNQVYAISLNGEISGITVGEGFTEIFRYSETTPEGVTSTENFDKFDESLAVLLEYFGVSEIDIPDGIDMTADFPFGDNISVFTGYIISYGEGILEGDTPKAVYITINPVEEIYGSGKTALKIPACFAGRLNNDSEYLFLLKDGEIVSFAGILELNENGGFSSPLGLNIENQNSRITKIDHIKIHYSQNHIAAEGIKDIFVGLGNMSGSVPPFSLSYTSINPGSSDEEENADVDITYTEGTLTVFIDAKNAGIFVYYRENDDDEVYFFDENEKKVYVNPSVYSEHSMALSYIISVTLLSETNGVYQSDTEFSYQTRMGNRFTLEMSGGELIALHLNGKLIAEVNGFNLGN